MGTDRKVCSRCRRCESFFYRPYSGEVLCKKCFLGTIEGKVRATIGKYKMFSFKDRIAVAVSGGKDSLSLLQILSKIEKKHSTASLVAIIVDEGIRGYRDEAIEIATNACKKLDIEHQVTYFKKLYGVTLEEIVERMRQTPKTRLSPCAYCGVLRRRALNVAALKVGANKIATGHTLDDETQTILLNIFHGDVPGIAREKPVTEVVHPRLVQRVKPFCEIPERETALYAYVKKIKFQSVPCPYSSEALRNDMRLMLNRVEEKHPGTKFTVFRSIEKIRSALEVCGKKEGFKECRECGEPASLDLCKTCQMLKQVNS